MCSLPIVQYESKVTKSVVYNHRVSIEWKSPYKESYTVNSCQKIFSDFGARVGFLKI